MLILLEMLMLELLLMICRESLEGEIGSKERSKLKESKGGCHNLIMKNSNVHILQAE